MAEKEFYIQVSLPIVKKNQKPKAFSILKI